MKHNMKTILVSSLSCVNRYLKNQRFVTPPCIYADRFAIKKETMILGDKPKEMASIRMWRTKSLLDWWYDERSSADHYIGALDYTIEKNHIRCQYITVNDGYNAYRESLSQLTEEESKELVHSMVHYLTEVAKQENKPKIVLDVHHNLRYYKKYFEKEGFVVTERKARDNRAWVETELSLEEDYCVK